MLVKKVKIKPKNKKVDFLAAILGTLAASVLGNMLASKPNLTGKGVVETREGQDF